MTWAASRAGSNRMTATAAPQPRACLPPGPTRPPQRLVVPSGAWDTHAHVIGGGAGHPFVAQRGYTPPSAGVDDFLAMLDTVGIQYGVVVQISVHGSDNRLLVESLLACPQRLRGVAVIDAATTARELAAMKEAGVTGIRINELFSGGSGAGALRELAARCADLGWHIDLALHGARLRELAPVLAGLKVPLVIDHMGWCAAQAGTAQADFQAVLSLVRDTGCWVKLSGAYRMSAMPAPYPDTVAFARALVEVAPDRMIWGSDWPHVALFESASMPQPGALLDVLHDQLQDAALERAVLVDNPARLYGLPGQVAMASSMT